jgi:hypothetical protein
VIGTGTRASAIIWLLLNVKHDELATDGPEGVAV